MEKCGTAAASVCLLYKRKGGDFIWNFIAAQGSLTDHCPPLHMSYSKKSNEEDNKVWMVYYDAWDRKKRGGCVIPGNLDRVIHLDIYQEDIQLAENLPL